jgi:Tfp pilus assembly protein PilF
LPQTPLGWEPQQDWLAAHCQLAATYLARGDKAKAAPLLERLLALWKDGDPDVPIVRRARAVYEKLKLQ